MPQLILEHSSNILEKNIVFTALKKINIFLNETLPTDLSSCKSRAVEYDTYCIGNGDKNNAFIHVNLKVMPGRNVDKLNEVGNGLIYILKECFCESAQSLNLQITLEIDELKTTYFKYVS